MMIVVREVRKLKSLLACLTLISLGVLAIACGGKEAVPTPTIDFASPSTIPSETAPPASQTATPLASVTAAPSAPIATLTNTSFGYSIEYPSDWILHGTGEDRNPTATSYLQIYNSNPEEWVYGEGSRPDRVKVEIIAFPNSTSLALSDWLTEYNETSPCPAKVFESTEVTTRNASGVRLLMTYSCGAPIPGYLWLISGTTHVYGITGANPDSPFLQTVSDIIASFTLG
jgi:hypothetical protein